MIGIDRIAEHVIEAVIVLAIEKTGEFVYLKYGDSIKSVALTALEAARNVIEEGRDAVEEGWCNDYCSGGISYMMEELKYHTIDSLIKA